MDFRKRLFVLVLPLLCLLAVPSGSAAEDDPPDLDLEHRVNQAIDRGLASLQGKTAGGEKNGNPLILLTYLHGGKDDQDPHFQSLLKECLEIELEHTYTVALIAMCLEEYDRVTYQWRIHQCAQFLVDNITEKGACRYGEPTDLSHIPVETPKPRKNVATSGGKKGKSGGEEIVHEREKPPVVRRIPVKQRRCPEKKGHDHSNMQYLALGLRACHDAGIVFEKPMLQRVQRWFKDAQAPSEGSFSVLTVDPPPEVKQSTSRSRKSTGTRTVVSLKARPRGWSYTKNSVGEYGYFGSMSAGGAGALCILSYMLGEDWRADQDVLDSMQWLAVHFSVTDNPEAVEKKQHWYLYYMYGLERAGMLFGTETIGDHRWYREGALELLKIQKENGNWGSPVNTCFAILFLKRATRSLPVATGARRRR